MPTDEAEALDIAALGVASGRTTTTLRRWMRWEGLPFTYRDRKVVVRRADWDEWRSRPEIAAMLAAGENTKKGIARSRANAV